MSLTVVTGPPCAGKTTYVADHRGLGDLVLDIDQLAHALGYPAAHIDWSAPADEHPARAAARLARIAVMNAVQSGEIPGRIWLIETRLHRISRKIYERDGAEFVHLDPGQAECHDRANRDGRHDATHDQIRGWYHDHSVL